MVGEDEDLAGGAGNLFVGTGPRVGVPAGDGGPGGGRGAARACVEGRDGDGGAAREGVSAVGRPCKEATDACGAGATCRLGE